MDEINNAVYRCISFISLVQKSCDQQRLYLEQRIREEYSKFCEEWRKSAEKDAEILKTEVQNIEDNLDALQLEEIILADKLLHKARSIRQKFQKTTMYDAVFLNHVLEEECESPPSYESAEKGSSVNKMKQSMSLPTIAQVTNGKIESAQVSSVLRTSRSFMNGTRSKNTADISHYSLDKRKTSCTLKGKSVYRSVHAENRSKSCDPVKSSKVVSSNISSSNNRLSKTCKEKPAMKSIGNKVNNISDTSTKSILSTISRSEKNSNNSVQKPYSSISVKTRQSKGSISLNKQCKTHSEISTYSSYKNGSSKSSNTPISTRVCTNICYNNDIGCDMANHQLSTVCDNQKHINKNREVLIGGNKPSKTHSSAAVSKCSSNLHVKPPDMKYFYQALNDSLNERMCLKQPFSSQYTWYPFISSECGTHLFSNIACNSLAEVKQMFTLFHKIQEAMMWIDLFGLLGKEIVPHLSHLNTKNPNTAVILSYLQSIYHEKLQRIPVVLKPSFF